MQSIHGYDNSFARSENTLEICQNANTTEPKWKGENQVQDTRATITAVFL